MYNKRNYLNQLNKSYTQHNTCLVEVFQVATFFSKPLNNILDSLLYSNEHVNWTHTHAMSVVYHKTDTFEFGPG